MSTSLVVPGGDCSFCANFRGLDPWHGAPAVVEQSASLYVIMAPAALGGMPGHTLVIPRRHVATVFDLNDVEIGEVFAEVVRIARGVRAAFDPAGLHIHQRNGVVAEQSVPHVHVHVIPVPEGGTWPPTHQIEITPSQVRAEQAALIRRHLN